MRPLLAAIVAITITITIEARDSEACSCANATACASLPRVSAVFIGTAQTVKRVKGHEHETTFDVEEVFVGNVGTTVVIHSTWNGGTCDTHFEAGARLIVYAEGPLHQLRSGCTPTQPVDQASKQDLAFLRGLKRTTTGTVSGEVVLRDVTRAAGEEEPDPKPRAGVVVRARGTSYTTRTDATGAYRLELPQGKHVLELVDPGTVVAPVWSDVTPVEVTVPGQCETRHFSLLWNGRIAGRVVDRHGKPVPNILVQAQLSDDRLFQLYLAATTDANGRYQIEGVPEGRYLVGVSLPIFDDRPTVANPYPATYHPGVPTRNGARRVRVAKSALTSAVDIKLGAKLPIHPVTLVINDRSVTRFWVRVANTFDDLFNGAPDRDGNVVIRVPAGPIEWETCAIEFGTAQKPSRCAVVKRTIDRALRIVPDLRERD